MASRRDEHGQMILLAGLLLVMSYLIFSTQTALLATVGQEAGREATSPLFTDFLIVRTGLAEAMDDELTDNAGVIQCPTRLTNWQGRVDTMLATITQLESNRGLSFHGTVVQVGSAEFITDQAPAVSNLELLTEVQLYLSDGDASIIEEVRFYTNCVGAAPT